MNKHGARRSDLETEASGGLSAWPTRNEATPPSSSGAVRSDSAGEVCL